MFTRCYGITVVYNRRLSASSISPTNWYITRRTLLLGPLSTRNIARHELYALSSMGISEHGESKIDDTGTCISRLWQACIFTFNQQYP